MPSIYDLTKPLTNLTEQLFEKEMQILQGDVPPLDRAEQLQLLKLVQRTVDSAIIDVEEQVGLQYEQTIEDLERQNRSLRMELANKGKKGRAA